MAITQEQADKVREYVNGLPEDKRSEFIKRYNALDTGKKSELVVRLSGKQTSSNEETGSDILPAALGVGALAGGGYLATMAGRKIAEPFVQKGKLSNEAEPIRKGLNLSKKTPIESLSPAIKLQIEKLSGEAQNITDLMAADIKNKIPQWKSENYRIYGEGIESINKELSNKGLNFSTKNFNTLLDEVASRLESEGLAKEAANIRKAMVKPKGGGLSQFLGFDQAKSSISNLRNNNPSASNLLTDRWAKFLETDPVMKQVPQIKTILEELNTNYKPFKEVSNTLDSLSKSNKGVFKTSALNKYMQDAISGKSSDAIRALEYLSKGSSTIKPLEGTDIHLSNIKNLSSNYSKLQRFMNKANELALRAEPIERAIGRRANVAKWGGALVGLGQIGKLFSVYPMVSQALEYNEQQKTLRELRKKYKSGNLSEQEKLDIGLSI